MRLPRLNIKLILAFAILSWLRFYHLASHVIFLGDQGRDAIIMKRILTLEHLPAIGPPTSIGMVYLGPFYYYFMAPWLALFQFNPLGPAVGVAVISVLGAVMAYFVIRELLGSLTAVFFLILLTFSAANISLSRFSWNPNLLPIFTFFTNYAFWCMLTRSNWLAAALFGAMVSFSLQLHYLTALLLPMYLVLFALHFDLKKALASILGFAFFSFPLLIFDLRHDFLNSRNFLKLFGAGAVGGDDSWTQRLNDTVGAFFGHVFQASLPTPVWLLLFLGLLFLFFRIGRNKPHLFYWLNLTTLAIYLVGFSLMNSGRFEHYFGPAYYAFFLILSHLFAVRFKVCRVCRVLIPVMLGIYIWLNFLKFQSIFRLGNNQIQYARQVTKSILPNVKHKPYQIVSLPFTETHGQFRYFLEIWGKTPLAEDALEQPRELFVLCYLPECNVLNNPLWQIASFSNKKIAKMWTIDRIKIYKLVHGQSQ